MEHPAVANLSCEECKKWLVDIETGKIKTRGGKPQRRPAGSPTPCHACPKKSPEHAKQVELNQRNWATVRLFVRNRAMQGRALTPAEAADELLQRNFGLIDTILRQWEGQRVADALGTAIAKLDATRGRT